MVKNALIARQKIIADAHNKQSAQLLVMHQSFIFSEMQLLLQKYFNNLVGRLQFFLEKIGKDPIFTTIMTLATKNEYCLGLTCFTNPIFSVTRGLLTVRLLKYKYSLRPIFSVSCMPDKLNYISAYYGAQATLTDNILSFEKIVQFTYQSIKK